MNSKRMRFSFLVLSVYAALGVVGIYSQAPTSATEICATDIVNIVASARGADTSTGSSSGGGGASVNVEWHSFLPGAFK